MPLLAPVAMSQKMQKQKIAKKHDCVGHGRWHAWQRRAAILRPNPYDYLTAYTVKLLLVSRTKHIKIKLADGKCHESKDACMNEYHEGRPSD